MASRVPTALYSKLRRARRRLNRWVFERSAETDGILLAILSRQNLFFLGDVGTAKSMQISLAAQLLGLSTFHILLSQSTKPEQVFGPPDIPGLAEGRQVWKIKNYAADSEVVFLDEIFKANDVVLNPLLELINEKKFLNGDEGKINCPLVSAMAASNEVPSDPSLRAIWDRFLLRYEVKYLRDKENIIKMMTSVLEDNLENVQPLFKREEIMHLLRLRQSVKVSNEIKETVIKIRDQVQTACQNTISDRRLGYAMRVIQAHAILKNRLVARLDDTEVLSNIFWDDLKAQIKTQAIVLSHASSDISDVLAYEDTADSIWENAIKTSALESGYKKLGQLYKTVKVFKTKSGKLVAGNIKSRMGRLKTLMEQRGSFSLLRVKTPKMVQYRVGMATATSWSEDELRSVGFHLRRKGGGYWYYVGPGKVLVRRIRETLHSEPSIKRIEAVDEDE